MATFSGYWLHFNSYPQVALKAEDSGNTCDIHGHNHHRTAVDPAAHEKTLLKCARSIHTSHLLHPLIHLPYLNA